MNTDTTSLAHLAKQFSGRAFGELVLEHCHRMTKAQTAAALLGTIQLLPTLSKETVDQPMKIMNGSAMNADFWRRDCGQTQIDVAAKTRQHMLAGGHSASDDDMRSSNTAEPQDTR